MNFNPYKILLGLTLLISSGAQAGITLVSAIPADNSTVKALSKISTVWDNDGEWLDLDYAVAVIKDQDGEQVATGRFSENWDYADTFDIAVNPVVSSPGEYTVEIPDNVFWDLTNEPAVLHYTVEDLGGEDVTFVRANPASGSELESLSTIDLYWDATMDITYDTSVKPRLVNTEGETVAIGKLSQDWNTNGHFTITFNPAFSTPGIYEVVLPDDCFFDLDNYEPVTSAEMRLSYTIAGSETPTTLGFERAYPANNSEVTSLSEIKLYWATGDNIFTLIPRAAAAIEDLDGNRRECTIVAGDDNTLFIIVIDPEIDEEGVYYITIPADIFLNAEGETVESEEVELRYNVKPVNYKEPFEAYFDSAKPAQSSRVASISVIRTYWDCTAEGLTIDEDAEVIVLNEEAEAVTYGYLKFGEPTDDLVCVEIELETEIRLNGTYIVSIPAGFLLDGDGDTVLSQNILLSYIVDTSVGAKIVNQDSSDSAIAVYTLDGQRLPALPEAKGIYIIVTGEGSCKRIIR